MCVCSFYHIVTKSVLNGKGLRFSSADWINAFSAVRWTLRSHALKSHVASL